MANNGQFGARPVVPPGWYADPVNPNVLRYWSGAGWTEHVAPAPVAAPVPPPAPAPAPGAARPAEQWAPTSDSGWNPSGYEAATPAYGAPSPTYGAPSPAYGAAMPGYGSATPGYGAAMPAYGAAMQAPWAQAQGRVPGWDLDAAPLGFGAAIASAFRNYVTFRGRASRSAYWWFALFALLVELPFYVWYMAGTISAVATAANATGTAPPSIPVGALVPGLFLGLVGLALFLPALGLAVRRLHDCDRSGWYYFMAFIPFVGSLILLIFYVQEGTPGPNQYSLSSGFGGQQPQATWR